MNLNNLTVKAQEAIQQAQQIAIGNEQQSIEAGHILKGMMEVDEHVPSFLFKKIGANENMITQANEQIVKSYAKVTGGDAYVGKSGQKALSEAIAYAKKNGDEFVTTEHLMYGLLNAGDQVAQLLKDAGINKSNLQKAIDELRQGEKVTSQSQEDTYNALGKYARNLNVLANEGKLDPVIGRDDEIRRVLQILSRRTKNNPVLIGEPGVGKTAIAEGLAHRIINGDIPDNLKSKVIYSLDMGALIAGAKYKGEFEERLKSVVKEVVKSDDIVLFIDEIHTLVGAGASEGAMDAANILKPALARGELRAVGATTLDEYQKHFEKDKALERRFQKVLVDEPSTEDAISILRGIKEKYETHHKVQIKDEAIISAVELSQRYITNRFLPDKAIDLIDEAAAKLRMEINSKPEEIDEIERKIMQLEIEREAIKREKDEKKLARIAEDLAELIDQRDSMVAAWQNEKDVVEAIQKGKEAIEQQKFEADQAERQGDYGKVAEIRYGVIQQLEEQLEADKATLVEMQSSSKMIKEEVDAFEVADVVARWTGIPVQRMVESESTKLLRLEDELHKRVVGQNEAIVAVADAIRRSRSGLADEKRPIGSFIFLGTTGVGKTELAKALSEFLFNDENAMTRIDMSEYQERHAVSRLVGAPPGYVGYDEGGQLTEAVRRKPYSVILLDEIEKAHPDVFNILLQVLEDGRLTDSKGRLVNFRNTIIIMTSNLGAEIIQSNFEDVSEAEVPQVFQRTKSEVLTLLKHTLRPEFLNRIDETIMFSPLGRKEISKIVEIQLGFLKEKLKTMDIDLVAAEAAIEYLAEAGYDPQFGARPVKRIIQKEVLNELSRQLLAKKIHPNSNIVLDVFDGQFVFRNPIPEEETV